MVFLAQKKIFFSSKMSSATVYKLIIWWLHIDKEETFKLDFQIQNFYLWCEKTFWRESLQDGTAVEDCLAWPTKCPNLTAGETLKLGKFQTLSTKGES